MYMYGILPSVSDQPVGYKAFTKLINHCKIEIVGNNDIIFDNGEEIDEEEGVEEFADSNFIGAFFGISGLVEHMVQYLTRKDRIKCNNVCVGLLDILARIPCYMPTTPRLLWCANNNSHLHHLTTTREASLSVISQYKPKFDSIRYFSHQWKHLQVLKLCLSHRFKLLPEEALKGLRENVLPYPSVICIDYGGEQIVGGYTRAGEYPIERLKWVHNLLFLKCDTISIVDTVGMRGLKLGGFESRLLLTDNVQHVEFAGVTLGTGTYTYCGENIKFLKLSNVHRYDHKPQYTQKMVRRFITSFPNLYFVKLGSVKDSLVMTSADLYDSTFYILESLLSTLKKRHTLKFLSIEHELFPAQDFSNINIFVDVLRLFEDVWFMLKVDYVCVRVFDSVTSTVDGFTRLFDVINNFHLDGVNVHFFGRFDCVGKLTEAYANRLFDRLNKLYETEEYNFGFTSSVLPSDGLPKGNRKELCAGFDLRFCVLEGGYFAFTLTIGDITSMNELMNECDMYEAKFAQLKDMKRRRFILN